MRFYNIVMLFSKKGAGSGVWSRMAVRSTEIQRREHGSNTKCDLRSERVRNLAQIMDKIIINIIKLTLNKVITPIPAGFVTLQRVTRLSRKYQKEWPTLIAREFVAFGFIVSLCISFVGLSSVEILISTVYTQKRLIYGPFLWIQRFSSFFDVITACSLVATVFLADSKVNSYQC